MANEIYHRSNWGNAVNDIAWGDTYEKFDATNEMFVRSDNYENSNETDKLMAAINPKPSILLTPTAYDNGSLHSVKPVKTFGSELVTNGDFSTDSDWTLDAAWTISNGKATYDNSATQTCRQSLSFEVGKKYLVNFEISDFTTDYRFDLYTGVSFIQSAIITDQTSFSILFDGDGGSIIRFRGLARGTGFSLDNVSVKEVIDADFDFTRGTIATRVNEQGLVADVTDTNLPRIDYTSGTGQILLEPQTTNLLDYSEDFSQWSGGSDITIQSGFLAPDGTNNAYKITKTGTSQPYLFDSAGMTTTTTRSIFAKTVSGTGTVNLLSHNSNTNNLFTLTENWQRFDVSSSNSTGVVNFYAVDFRGSSSLSEIIVFGANATNDQAFATSYIPTSGSTVTRNADVCKNAGSTDLINSTEGVLYAEISALSNTSDSSKFITISDGTYNNRASILFSNGSTNQIRTFLRVGGASQIDVSDNVTDVTDFNKVAFSYKENDFKVYINGSLVSSDTNGSVWSEDTITKLSFSEINTSVGLFNGNVKCIAVYKEALTDAQLTALTT